MAAKKDLLHDGLKIVDYSRWTYFLPILGVLLVCGITWAMAARVPSLLDPGVRVKVPVFNAQAADAQAELDKRAAQLKAEAAKLQADQNALDSKVIQAGEAQKRHNEMIAQILQFTGGAITQAASGQPVNPLAIVTSLLGLAGGLASVGASVLDPKRRTAIKTQLVAAQKAT